MVEVKLRMLTLSWKMTYTGRDILWIFFNTEFYACVTQLSPELEQYSSKSDSVIFSYLYGVTS